MIAPNLPERLGPAPPAVPPSSSSTRCSRSPAPRRLLEKVSWISRGSVQPPAAFTDSCHDGPSNSGCSGRSSAITVPTSCAHEVPPQSTAHASSATPPPGRSTRAISANAPAGSNQWNASATVTAATDPSSSGIASAVPSRTRSDPIASSSNHAATAGAQPPPRPARSRAAPSSACPCPPPDRARDLPARSEAPPPGGRSPPVGTRDVRARMRQRSRRTLGPGGARPPFKS